MIMEFLAVDVKDSSCKTASWDTESIVALNFPEILTQENVGIIGWISSLYFSVRTETSEAEAL